MLGLNFFRQIWLYDFEFTAPEGDNPDVICLVAHELHSGQKLRLWRDELGAEPPFSTAADVLFVAYYASAEVGCHLALSWPVPLRLLDLFTEFRCLTNGTPPPCGNGLIGALAYFGLDSIGSVEKEEMRALAMRGGPWTRTERSALLDYCELDVAALTRLLSAMLPSIDLPRALLRGRFMVAAARIERNGVPVDTETLGRLKRHWHDIEDRLIADIDTDYRCYVGRSFSEGRFAEWLARAGIRWPALESGRLELKDEVFRQAARTHPEIAPLRELRYALSQIWLNELPVGKDGRNRTILSAFRATTSRNQPSSTKYIFGPGVWLRGLVKPPRGYGICYLDWEQQEFAIAGALSGDPLMLDAYRSGDPYLAFAKQAGAAPPDATKLTHKAAREQFKQCVLAVQYGMGPDSLACVSGNLGSMRASSCACTVKPTAFSGAGPTITSPGPWRGTACKPRLAGNCMSQPSRMCALWQIFRCRAPAQKC